MRYSLEGELAKKYGITEAFLLGYFQYYLESAERKQDPAKYHDGRYWTYASVREIEKSMDFKARLNPQRFKKTKRARIAFDRCL